MSVKLKVSILFKIMFLGALCSSAMPVNLSLPVYGITFKSPVVILALLGNLPILLKVLSRRGS